MRYVPHTRQIIDEDSGNVIGIYPAAFKLRPEDKGALSVNWIEFYGSLDDESIALAADGFRKNLQKKKLAQSALFALGNVGEAKRRGKLIRKPIRILHEPEGENDGHATIRQLDDNDQSFLDALANEVFLDRRAVAKLKLPKA